MAVFAAFPSLFAAGCGSGDEGGASRFLLEEGGASRFLLEVDRAALRSRIAEDAPDATDADIERRCDEAVAKAERTAEDIVRKRLRSIGFRRSSVSIEPGCRLRVTLSGASPERLAKAVRLATSEGRLEFRLVSPLSSRKAESLLAKAVANKDLADNPYVPAGFTVAETIGGKWYGGRCYVRDPAATEPDLRALRSFGQPDTGYVFMLEKDTVRRGEDVLEVYYPIYVDGRPRLTGDTLLRAKTDNDPMRGVVVDLRFNAEGAKQFAELTTRFCSTPTHPGRQLAIVMDGIVYSAPVLTVPITDGRAVISGSFTDEEAKRLVAFLNAGALPVPFVLVSDPPTGPPAQAGAGD